MHPNSDESGYVVVRVRATTVGDFRSSWVDSGQKRHFPFFVCRHGGFSSTLRAESSSRTDIRFAVARFDGC